MCDQIDYILMWTKPVVFILRTPYVLASFRPPISAGPKTGDDESDGDAERSPIETHIAFEVVDENEAFWKLFPTKSAGVSQHFFIMLMLLYFLISKSLEVSF